MLRTNICVVLLLGCCILSSCGVFYDDLGHSYAWLENREIVKITDVKENSLSFIEIIRPQVLNYDCDDTFIIAYQIYDGGEYYDSFQKNEEKDSLMQQFAILKKLKYCYWIINKETGQVFGPMVKHEFEGKCQKLHVKAKMQKFKEKKYWEDIEEH